MDSSLVVDWPCSLKILWLTFSTILKMREITWGFSPWFVTWKKVSNYRKTIFNGKEEGGKKPWRMMPQLCKKEFEKNHGKKLVSITSIFVTCISFLIFYIFIMITNLSPFIFLKGHEGGFTWVFKLYFI